LHVLVKDTTGKRLYISNQVLEKIWGHGMTDMQRLKGEDVGRYYVTYFTCIQAKKEDIAEDEIRQGRKKAEKSDRLKFYPMGFRFYRRSKGIKDPGERYMSEAEYASAYPVLTESKSYDIVSESGETVNRIERTLRKRK
jgi:hypothetical protein